MVSMTYLVELLSLFRSLEEEISAFSRAWLMQGTATVYRIALYKEGRVPDGVDVESVRGSSAVELVDSALNEFKLREGQAPGSVFRVPGIAHCQKDLLPQLAKINARKDQLRQAIVHSAPTTRARNVLVRRLFPGRNMLQVYRHIHFAGPDVTRIAFAWSPVTSATTTLTQVEARMLITTRLDESVSMEPEVIQSHEIALQALGALTAASKVIQRRPVAPHPRITLFTGNGRKASKKTHHANLPLFVAHGQSVGIGTLKTYDPGTRRRTRSDQKKLVPLLYYLNLYMTL